jgi:hypothetical protein
LQPPWNPRKTGLIDNIFIRRDGGNCPQRRVSAGQTCQATMNDLLILTTLLPWSDDSNNNSLEPLPR